MGPSPASHGDALRNLIAALHNPALYDHPVTAFEVIETHISYVLLTGPYAYKIKKPLDLGFLDFSSLEKRRFFCHEELRLNRRLAPQLYVDVVAVTGSAAAPALNGPGPAIEYAVKMVQFPQDALLDRHLGRSALTVGYIDLIARTVAEFHGRIATAPPDSPFGTPERAHYPVAENFRQIRPLLDQARDLEHLERLEVWSEREYAARREVLQARKRDGYIRECHGDMHLGNMALLDGALAIFDGIEFNDNLRWIDVISEVAFFCMDLEDRGRADFARRFLNAYLEITGDYGALELLRYYQAYRAMVRAKVSIIRLGQPGVSPEEREAVRNRYRGYATLAERYTAPGRGALIITHGVSGSGKTTHTQPLVEALGAIRIRSDVERKRLFGLSPEARSAPGIDSGLYSPEASGRTYRRLEELAQRLTAAGHTVIVDAAFLKRAQRERFRDLARHDRLPFAILEFTAREDSLRRRVARREQAGRDASEAGRAVLEHQLATREPLQPEERGGALTLDTDAAPDYPALAARLEQIARVPE
ncbi:MAG: AAA family ATPase [Gammaproteobacteria bacterium]|nr:AAA family ATPase [Gammaproteobacteria bacterium]